MYTAAAQYQLAQRHFGLRFKPPCLDLGKLAHLEPRREQREGGFSVTAACAGWPARVADTILWRVRKAKCPLPVDAGLKAITILMDRDG